MKKAWILFLFMCIAAWGEDLFPPAFRQALTESYVYFGPDRVFDFTKTVGTGKECFGPVGDFIDRPSEEFDHMNDVLGRIISGETSFLYGVPKKKIKKGKGSALLELTGLLREMDGFFQSAFALHIKEEVKKPADLMLISTDKAAGLFKAAGLSEKTPLFQRIIALAGDIDWKGLADRDEEGLIYCGADRKSGDYLIYVDRSGADVECVPVLGRARLYVKTEDCNAVKGSPASAFFGLSIFLNLATSSTEYSGESAMNAFLGFSYFRDAGGNDIYRYSEFCEAAAAFGISYLVDEGGNDEYSAGRYAQAFTQTLGIAVLNDHSGNDIYFSGNKDLHEPLYNDRYQSLSQGYSIGDREQGYAGGISVLRDGGGNDRYIADVYAQGCGYWYSLGVLIDEKGNDVYSAHIYGQGSGVHLAAGILFDGGGNDAFSLLDGVGLGGGHDLSLGILINANIGNDAYQGSGITMGSGHANGCGIFFDEGGNDSYAGAKDMIIGGTGFADRDAPSFGLFYDGGGDDAYTRKEAGNSKVWLTPHVGVGIDK